MPNKQQNTDLGNSVTVSKNNFELTRGELKHVQQIIDAKKPDRYTLRQLFGKKAWDAIGSNGLKREYGERFWQSYIMKRLRKVTSAGHKSNSRAYIVVDGWSE